MTSTISPPFPVRSSFPHLSVIPVPKRGCSGLAQHERPKWRKEVAACELPASALNEARRSKRRPCEHRIAVPKLTVMFR